MSPLPFYSYHLTGCACPKPNPINSERNTLLKEAFQLLWVLAMHTPLPLRDMAQGAGMFNTMVRSMKNPIPRVLILAFRHRRSALF